MPARPLVLLASALTLWSIGAPSVEAQGGAVSAVAVSADHDLLLTTLYGGAARVSVPLGSDGASIRLGAERVSGNARRTGSTCSGLVEPGTCGPEPLRDDVRLSTASIGFGYGALAGARFALDLAADLRFGQVHVETRGQTSGGAISISKGLRGVELGVNGSWIPVARFPIALAVGAAVGELGPVVSEQIVDGYTPFEGEFTLRHLRVGVSWRPALR